MGARSPIVHAHPTPRVISRQVNLAYEMPLTFVDSFEGIVRHVERATGILPAFGWQDGDANAPSYWLGAVNAIDRLTATGAPVPGQPTPYQDAYGTAITAEDYGGATCRTTATACDPALGDDLVVAMLLRRDANAATNRPLGTYTIGRGFNFTWTAGSALAVFWLFGDVILGASAGLPFNGLVLLLAVVDRDGNFTAYSNGIAGVPVGTPAGSLVGNGFGLGARPNGAERMNGAIAWASVWYGAGIADTWNAATGALIQQVTRRALGIERRTGFAGPTAARNTAASWQDSHNRRHHLASAGLYRAGSVLAGGESGCRIAPSRTNKCYENVNTTVAGAALWTVDDASAVGRIDDSAALAAAAEPAEAWGPFVCRYANATGANRYMWIPGSTTNVNAHALQVMARIVAGAGAWLGLMDTAAPGPGGWTALAAITDGYLRTVVNNVTPGAATERLCLMLPNGCEVRWIAHQLEEGITATSPIPNWSTIAGAARAAEGIQLPMPPADGQGGYEIGITPMGWGAGVGGQEFVISRVGVADQAIYMTAADLWATYDGVTVCAEGAPTAADGVRQVIRVGWHGARQTISVDGVEVATVYAGARMGGGNIAIYPILREWAIDSVKVFRRPAP